MLVNEFTTDTRAVRVGQLWRDNRASNVRTLRVDSIAVTQGAHTNRAYIACTVIRQEYDGDVTEPMRQTTMTADRLTSRAFVLAEEI